MFHNFRVLFALCPLRNAIDFFLMFLSCCIVNDKLQLLLLLLLVAVKYYVVTAFYELFLVYDYIRLLCKILSHQLNHCFVKIETIIISHVILHVHFFISIIQKFSKYIWLGIHGFIKFVIKLNVIRYLLFG